MKKIILIIAYSITALSFLACMGIGKKENEEYLDNYYKPENVGQAPKDEDGHVPYFNFQGPGNFTDIDEIWYKNPKNTPDQYVGVWYEDGFTNGYRLEIYGNATWQFFGEETVCGYCEFPPNGQVWLVDAKYGISAQHLNTCFDEELGVTVLDIDNLVDLIPARNKTSDITMVREADSKYCDDLEAYYKQKFPGEFMKGFWYPVGDYSALNFFEFTADMHWGEQIDGRGMLEVGLLEDIGDGKYFGIGANGEEEYYFEFPGDGYMYHNGIQFEKRDNSFETLELLIDKYRLYDYETNTMTEGGYEFFEDGTFKTLTDDPNEHGTYIYVYDYLILYDDNGVLLHNWYFNVFSARHKIIDIEDYDQLYGEGPKKIYAPYGSAVTEDEEESSDVPEEMPEDEVIEYNPDDSELDDSWINEDFDDYDGEVHWEGEDNG